MFKKNMHVDDFSEHNETINTYIFVDMPKFKLAQQKQNEAPHSHFMPARNTYLAR